LNFLVAIELFVTSLKISSVEKWSDIDQNSKIIAIAFKRSDDYMLEINADDD